MKRLSIIALLLLLCSLPGYSQFWIEFGWHDAQCRQCVSMSQSLRLNPKQARDYQKIVHKYGQKIEKEARRDYKHWDKAARRIYDLRMDRDRKIQRMLNPQQFSMYVHAVQARPQRIHDYNGWYENPRYAGYRHSPDWRRLENQYWNYHWNLKPAPHYDNRPPQPKKGQAPHPNNRRNDHRDDRRDDRYNNRPGRR
ncbi:hypothetical protein M2480_001133 [Parabacteroides sp. PFB2-12]|uniref:hypothetical protein n=1 Tax=unclassified Parabacteroides TaxID=2649774 RepID=UPI0024731A6C|nr:MULTISPECIES: hypothetical protein [unclassified Parabacteroides]MDH6342511.1 hypothetical protein [Parabacteroides sp. PM6-13]MDH6390163.1 hypothetical protein [Parabacteroides sp. PFB2-12]